MLFLERFWISICGVDASFSGNFYWELFVDACLVAGCSFLPNVLRTSPNPEGVVEFSLLYFSLINGWFLYAHQYASRFREVSRLHWLLIWMFISSMFYGVMNASFQNYREFSESMILLRASVFLMLARVACYVDRAQPIAALLAVFIGDAILCFALSAASDVESAAILWGFVAITELHVDLFLAAGLRGPLQIPYRLENTMDRFYAVLFAPIGAIVIDTFCNTSTKQESLYAFSSLVMMTLFGMLYFAFKEDIVNSMRQRSQFEKASLLILLKMLGYALWTITACLLVEPNLNIQSFTTNLMGWMVGAALFCFLNLRSLAGRRHDYVGVIWFIFSTIPFLLARFVTSGTPMVLLSIYVTMISILNMLEAWHIFEALESSSRNALPEEAATTTARHSNTNNGASPGEQQPLVSNSFGETLANTTMYSAV